MDRWRSTRVRLNPPAAPAALAALDALFAGGAPQVLRSLLTTANGMKDYETDSRQLSLWSAERIAREHDVVSLGDERWIAIGDFFIRASCVRLCSSRDAVRIDGVDEEIPSLADFLERHLASSGS